MRITNKMISREFMNNLSSIYTKLNANHLKVSTGKAFQKPSEDPINAVRSMEISSKLERSGQYEENISNAQMVLNECENSLSGVNDSLLEVKSCLQKAMNDSTNEENKAGMAQIVNNMRDNILNLLNKEYGGKYIFGGYNSSSSPMKLNTNDVQYNGKSLLSMDFQQYTDLKNENVLIKTGRGTEMNVSVPGVRITGYGEDSMLNVLDQISKSLTEGNASDSLEHYSDKIDEFFNKVQSTITSIGSKVSSLEIMGDQILESKNALTNYLSSVEDADMEKAITDFKTSEMVYNAALAVGAKIIQPTLVDFLR